MIALLCACVVCKVAGMRGFEEYRAAGRLVKPVAHMQLVARRCNFRQRPPVAAAPRSQFAGVPIVMLRRPVCVVVAICAPRARALVGGDLLSACARAGCRFSLCSSFGGRNWFSFACHVSCAPNVLQRAAVPDSATFSEHVLVSILGTCSGSNFGYMVVFAIYICIWSSVARAGRVAERAAGTHFGSRFRGGFLASRCFFACVCACVRVRAVGRASWADWRSGRGVCLGDSAGVAWVICAWARHVGGGARCVRASVVLIDSGGVGSPRIARATVSAARRAHALMPRDPSCRR